MKLAMLLAIALVLAPFGGQLLAAEHTLSSRSAGKLHADTATDLSKKRAQQDAIVRPLPQASEDYASRPSSQRLEGVANRHDQVFEIYEADVRMLADLDGDGYHHVINVYFDVDVSVGDATVYAKLYLSREGGPWMQYFTTSLFDIHRDDHADAYEVETELLDGYRPGYYEVLIEIYSLDHAYLVTSAVLDHHYLGKDVMIEDRARDEPYDEYVYEEVYYSSGGGSMALLLLAFLIIQVVIAARGPLAKAPLSSPRNDRET